MVQAQAWRSQRARVPAGTGISTVISWPGPAEAAANPANQRVGRWTALAGRERRPTSRPGRMPVLRTRMVTTTSPDRAAAGR
jgi:hypothetical protein